MTQQATEQAPLLDNADVPHPEYPPVFAQWLEWCQEFPYLRSLCDLPASESPPPAPMKRDAFAALIGSLRSERHRPILRLVLLDLLYDDVKAMIERKAEGGEL